MATSISITKHLSPEQWHELYHYMGSRALHASEFFGRELRKGHLSASGRELILERMLNETSWANTVAVIARSTTSVQTSNIIRSLTGMLLSPHACDDASHTGYTKLYEDSVTVSAAFPVTARVWWDLRQIEEETNVLKGIEDVISAYEQDIQYIHRETAFNILDPPMTPGFDPAVALFQARQAGEAALSLVDHRLDEAKRKLQKLQEMMRLDPRIVFDDETGVDRLSMYYMDAMTKPADGVAE